MILPADDNILLSLINTKLRDKYGSLDELCEEEDVSSEEICARLSAAGFSYDEARNSFR